MLKYAYGVSLLSKNLLSLSEMFQITSHMLLLNKIAKCAMKAIKLQSNKKFLKKELERVLF